MLRLVGNLGLLGMVACGRSGFEVVGTNDGMLGTIVTFGERSTADVRNVTSDTQLVNETGMTDDNYGGDTRFQLENNEKIALLRIDVSVLAPGTTITTAALEIVVSGTPAGTLTVRPLREPWAEGNGVGITGAASYDERLLGVAWTTRGAGSPGSAGAAIVTRPLTEGANLITIPASTVQGWIDSPSTNDGLVLTGSGDVSVTSSEGIDAERPLLTLTRP